MLFGVTDPFENLIKTMAPLSRKMHVYLNHRVQFQERDILCLRSQTLEIITKHKTHLLDVKMSYKAAII